MPKVARPASGVALTAAVLAIGGCAAASDTNFMKLPDLATQAPSRQQVLTPADQKKAIDDLIAKRDKQAAEAAAGQATAAK